MTIVNTTTGEIVEPMTAADARRLTIEARSEFDSAADHFIRGWTKVEEAVGGGGYLALGYRSPGDYLHAEFDGVLADLNTAERRIAVKTMTSWGLSTRAIAPVVGVSHKTVVHDNHVVPPVPPMTPAPESLGEEDDGAGSTPEDEGNSASGVSDPAPTEATPRDNRPVDYPEAPAPAPRPPVIGIDGKTYTPKPRPTVVPAAKDDVWTDHDRAEDLARNLSRNLSLLYAVTTPERRAEYIATWRDGIADVRPLGSNFVTPKHMRELAAALHTFATEWENANV